MSTELVWLKCARCDHPLRMVDKSLAGRWFNPRCPQISPRIGRFGFIDEAGLSPCQSKALNAAIKDQEKRDLSREWGVSDTDWQSWSREERNRWFWSHQKRER